jgi:protein-tyrosine phosphatase
MAEFVFKDMVNKRGLEDNFLIASAATSSEEIGNAVHYGTRNKLKKYGILVEGKYAVRLEKQDYEKYDYLIGMDQINVTNMRRIIGADPLNKLSRLLEFAGEHRDIADPWYTGDFDQTYDDVLNGCKALLTNILQK